GKISSSTTSTSSSSSSGSSSSSSSGSSSSSPSLSQAFQWRSLTPQSPPPLDGAAAAAPVSASTRVRIVERFFPDSSRSRTISSSSSSSSGSNETISPTFRSS